MGHHHVPRGIMALRPQIGECVDALSARAVTGAGL